MILDQFEMPIPLRDYYYTDDAGRLLGLTGDQVYDFSTAEQAAAIRELLPFVDTLTVASGPGAYGPNLQYLDGEGPKHWTISGTITAQPQGEQEARPVPMDINVGRLMREHRERFMRSNRRDVPFGDVLAWTIVQTGSQGGGMDPDARIDLDWVQAVNADGTPKR